tara:strand:+ start:44538 stop:44708 length:171 start_codon:yes stop_codon:yes gene_type:complete
LEYDTEQILRIAHASGGLPMDVFDGFRSARVANRAQFYRKVAEGPFYGFNRDCVDL